MNKWLGLGVLVIVLAFVAWFFFISRTALPQPMLSPQPALPGDCADAEKLARDYEQSGPPAGVNVAEYIQQLEEDSRRCGFTWCNPQYCH